MKFVHILTELWCKPTLITPMMHRQICRIVEAHLDGKAHQAGGIVSLWSKEEETDAPEIQRVGQDDQIAVIPIQGVIGKHVGSIAKSSGVTDIDDISEMVQAAVSDPTVKGIFYDVASPGGGVTGIPEAAAEIRKAAQKKPSVTFTDEHMASAAYWLGSGARAIYATQSAQVGSIGVYMAWLDRSRMYDMAGVRVELIKQGKFKAMGIDGLSLTDEQRELLQSEVDEVAGWFKGAVRKHRGDVPVESMEGQTFFTEKALKAGLVDRMGDRTAAFRELESMIRLGEK
jgi:signal peptide peptidase SppA